MNEEHSLLFCAPPNTGSLQFRMLAKRMKVCNCFVRVERRSDLKRQRSELRARGRSRSTWGKIIVFVPVVPRACVISQHAERLV